MKKVTFIYIPSILFSLFVIKAIFNGGQLSPLAAIVAGPLIGYSLADLYITVIRKLEERKTWKVFIKENPNLKK